MRKIAILVFCLALANCAKVETASNDNAQNNSNKTIAVSPTVEKDILLKPITPNVKFTAKQQKYLNESLPPKVREVLEKAEKFEVLAELRKDDESDDEPLSVNPNRIVKIAGEKDKQEILEAFYHDASIENSPAICYEPRHSIKATYQGKTVEVEICFSCSRFIVRGDFGKFDGTLVREDRKSEDLFSRIIESKGTELKQ